jgi:hypothetical protein
LVDEASDRVGRLVKEVCDRGRDEQPDRELKLRCGRRELGEEFVR